MYISVIQKFSAETVN